MGKVIKLVSSSDGSVRSAKIKIASVSIWGPIIFALSN